MFTKSFKASFSLNAEAEAELFLSQNSRNKVLQRAKQKAHVIHERGTVRVAAPFADEEDAGAAYAYGGLQSFDRRAFVAALEDAHARRCGGYTERVAVVLDDDGEGTVDALSIVALFAKVDVNGDGGVTREELVKNCHLLNLSVEDAHRLFDKLDVNGDGEVSSEEFAEAVVQIENNAVRNLVHAVCEGDAGRLHDGLQRHTATASHVDTKRLHVKVTVDAHGVGLFGPLPLLNFPNQTGDLGRRLGGDADRRIPKCSHVATDELEIACLGLPGHGVAGGLFLIAGDTLLHAVLRNAHLPNRVELADVLLAAGSDPNAVSSDGRRPYELDLQGRRHVWRRELADVRAREAGHGLNMATFAGTSGI